MCIIKFYTQQCNKIYNLTDYWKMITSVRVGEGTLLFVHSLYICFAIWSFSQFLNNTSNQSKANLDKILSSPWTLRPSYVIMKPANYTSKHHQIPIMGVDWMCWEPYLHWGTPAKTFNGNGVPVAKIQVPEWSHLHHQHHSTLCFPSQIKKTLKTYNGNGAPDARTVPSGPWMKSSSSSSSSPASLEPLLPDSSFPPIALSWAAKATRSYKVNEYKKKNQWYPIALSWSTKATRSYKVNEFKDIWQCEKLVARSLTVELQSWKKLVSTPDAIYYHCSHAYYYYQKWAYGVVH